MSTRSTDLLELLEAALVWVHERTARPVAEIRSDPRSRDCSAFPDWPTIGRTAIDQSARALSTTATNHRSPNALAAQWLVSKWPTVGTDRRTDTDAADTSRWFLQWVPPICWCRPRVWTRNKDRVRSIMKSIIVGDLWPKDSPCIHYFRTESNSDSNS